MNPNGPQPPGDLPLPLARQLDQACNRFEAAWRNGERPDVEAFVAGVAEEVRAPLREELARLDSYYRSLRDTPHGEATTDDSTAATSVSGSATIPGYEILAEFGRGGMGVVYKARQTSVNRMVALKMVLAGGHAAQAQLARFLAEAEAVAQLEHPNLVRLYEVGQHDGLPYFTMEFVAGGSLSQRLDGTPLPATDAAALVEQLAHGMDYAHRRGIVHRDLKPGNVLLQESGVRKQESGKKDAVDTSTLTPGFWIPKITDFGLAKRVQTCEAVTATGAVLGTPSYMAPEQAEGKTKEVGPAADIYALGAILYQCLTGRPPFRGPTPLDTIRQAIGDEPVPPARLNPTVPRDLETICLKCLQKDPRKRYADAGELAKDLHRFLAGEPIQGRPVDRLERAVRWVRKRPATAALLALVTLVLVAGVAGLFWYQHQRLAGLVHQQGVDQEIARAVDDTEQLPVDIHRQLADPVQFAELLSDIESWKTTLDRARAAWERADRLTAANPSVLDPALLTRVQTAAAQRDTDEADWRLAKHLDDVRLEASTLVGGKFDPARADPDYASAFNGLGFDFDKGNPAEMAKQLREHRLRYVLVAALDHWSNSMQEMRIRKAAAGRKRRVLETARLADPDPWRDRVRDAENWQSQQALLQLAAEADCARQSPQILGLLTSLISKDSENTVLLRKALLVHPRDFWLNFDLAGTAKDPAERVGCYRAALAIRPRSSVVYSNLGNVLDDLNDVEGAIRHYEKAIAVDPKFATAYNNLGASYYARKKDLQAAIRYFTEAISLDANLAPAYYNLGMPLRDLKDWDRAIEAYEKAIALKANYAEAYHDLGLAFAGKNDLDRAIRSYEKAIAINPDYLQAHGNLGNALYARKDFDGATRHYEKVLAIEPNDAAGHNNLGHVLLEKKDLKKAIWHLEKAIVIDPNYPEAHINLGYAFGEKRDLEKAVKHYEKAIDLDPNSADAHNGLGTILRLKNDLGGAIRHAEKAIAINPSLAAAHNTLGRALQAKNQLDRAVEQFEKAIAIDANRAEFHRNLGVVLAQKNDMPEAIRRFNKALDLDPNDADAHYNLGLVLFNKKDFDGALGHYEKAAAINPQFVEAVCNLGHTYREKGDFEKAVAYLKRGHELGSAQAGWHYPSEQWLKHSQQLLALDRKVSAVLRHEAEPAGWQERLLFADLCRRYKRNYTAAAAFYAEALAANPTVAKNPEGQLRFLAAACAAQASAGLGKDASKLDDQAKAKLRQQALDWLQADLDLYDQALRTRASEKDAFTLLLAVKHMDQWRGDAALGAVREDKALADLPAEEQKQWRQLWSHAAELAKSSRACFSETAYQGTLTAKKREETYDLKLQAGQIVIIEMESPQFDTYLRLEDDQGKVIAENDDISPDNLNSRLVFTAPKAALYRIVATSFQQRGQGAYTLTIRELKAGGVSARTAWVGW